MGRWARWALGSDPGRVTLAQLISGSLVFLILKKGMEGLGEGLNTAMKAPRLARIWHSSYFAPDWVLEVR